VSEEDGPDLLLFVAGEPDSGVGQLHNVQSSFTGRLLTTVTPFGRWSFRGDYTPRSSDYEHPPLRDARPWHIPGPQVQCAEMAFVAADAAQKSIGVIDINRPGTQEAFVARWVGPDDVMPVLVRPDGAALRGVEAFVPGRVRRFVRGR